MKKFIPFLVAVLGFSVLFPGCTKKEYTSTSNAFSDFVQVSPQNWQISQDGNSFQYVYDASSVPNGFLYNTDGVLIYASGDKNIYSPLPLTTAVINNFYLDYYMADNTIVLELLPADGSKVSNSNKPTSDFYFNLVFVQPQDLTSSSVNVKDYNSVKAAFHLR